jgi:cytochrome c
MNNQWFNVAFAALLTAGIIAMMSGKVSDLLVSPEKLKEDAVKVEVAETTGVGGAPKVAMPEPILAMIATADIERGKAVAKACAACHNFEKGGANGVGPGMWGVVGAAKQAHAGYQYSGALDDNGEPNWTYFALNKFLWKPKAYSPGTKMNFIGVKKPEDRAALIAYLRSLADTPKPLPSEAEIAEELAKVAPPVADPVPAAEATATDAPQDATKDATAPADAKAPAAPSAADVKETP